MVHRIESAFNRFDAGERPEHYGKPKAWYVQRIDGRLYPLKGIWGLATNQSTNDFNTVEAKAGLSENGYKLFKTFD